MIKKIFSNCKKVLPCVYDGALSVAEQIAKLFKRTDDLDKKTDKIEAEVGDCVKKNKKYYDPHKITVYGSYRGDHDTDLTTDELPLQMMNPYDPIEYGIIPQRGQDKELFGNTESIDPDGGKFVHNKAYINKEYFDQHAATPESVADLMVNKRNIVPPDKIGGVGRLYAAIAKTAERPEGTQGYFNVSPSATRGGYIPQRDSNGQIELPNQSQYPPTLNQAMSRREMRKYLPNASGVFTYKDGGFDKAVSIDEPVTGVTDGSIVRRNSDGQIMGEYAGNPSPLISSGQADENYLGRFDYGSAYGVLEQAGGYNWQLTKADYKGSDLSGDKWVVEKNGVAKHDEHGSLYSTASVISDPNLPQFVTEGETQQVLTEELARNYFTKSEIEVVSLWDNDWFGPQTNFNGVNDVALGNVHSARIQVIDNTNFPFTATSQSTAYLTHIDYNLAIVDLYTRTLNDSGEIVKIEVYKGIYLGNSLTQQAKAFKKVLLGSVDFS